MTTRTLQTFENRRKWNLSNSPIAGCLAVVLAVASGLAACATTKDPLLEGDDGGKPRGPKISEDEGCQNGDQRACAELGLRYLRGDGVVADAAKAMAMFEKSCNAGVARGCAYMSGRLIATGTDLPRAYTLAERACSMNDGVGCHHLASLYESGLGTARNPARALALHEQACQAEVYASCASAGDLHERGTAGAVDDVKAWSFHHRACINGVPSSCAQEGRLLLFGTGVSRDATRGQKLSSDACQAHDSTGCATLSLAGLRGVLPTTGAPDSTPFATLEKACNEGHREFCIELAGLMKEGKTAGDEVRQRTLLRQACDSGWKRGCDALVP